MDKFYLHMISRFITRYTPPGFKKVLKDSGEPIDYLGLSAPFSTIG